MYPDHEWIKTIPNASYVDMDTLLRYKSSVYLKLKLAPLVAGAWTERKKMYHGGSFLKLAHDNV